MRLELKEEVGMITCIRPSLFRKEMEFYDGETLTGTFRFPAWPPWKGIVEGGGKKWEIARTSIFRREISIREAGYELPFARFSAGVFGRNGVIELPKGVRLRFIMSLWRRTYTLVTDRNEPVIQMRANIGLKKGGDIMMTSEGKMFVDKFPWIPALLWYLARRHGRGK